MLAVRGTASYPNGVRKRGPWVLAVAGLCLAAGPLATGQPAQSGIAGRVVDGPTCPVEQTPPASRCGPRPLAAPLRIRREHGPAHAFLVNSSRDGRFRVVLEPGHYVITPRAQSGSPLPRPPAPVEVIVRLHRFSHVMIEYDTGIR
jgi:hypothetical protein